MNTFGLSGSNAHVILEGYEETGSTAADCGPQPGPAGAAQPVVIPLPEAVTDALPATMLQVRATRLLPLSGKTDNALRELAGRYLAWLDSCATESATDPLLADMAWTASTGRSHFACRAGVVFDDVSSLRDQLRALTEARHSVGEPRPVTKVAFLYSGQGSQWSGMGATLYESEPVVRAVLDRCDSVLRTERQASLLDVMFGQTGAAGDLDDPAWTQPALYALEIALTALWSSVGIRPHAVLGHQLGEIAAAQTAGVFSLEAGLRFASAWGTRLSTRPEAAGKPTLADVETALTNVTIAPPSLALVSNATGQMLEAGSPMDATFWYHQFGQPAECRAGVAALASLEVEVVVEIGPDAVLGPQVCQVWPEVSASAEVACAPVVLGSLHRTADKGSSVQREDGFVEAVAGAYEAGLPLSLAGMFVGETRRRIALPSYPFQRRRHWI